MSKLLIIGAGGHGRVIADCAEASSQYSDIAFLDDTFPERGANLNWPIIDKSSQWKCYQDEYDFALAMGNNKARLAMYRALSSSSARLPNIIHPQAVVSKHVSLGAGNVIFANAVINPGTQLGNACIINTAATIDHDCNLADAVHISPGAHLAGTVHVGELTWFGVGSCSVQCVDIAENTQVGAGAAVTQSTEANGLYVGVPAKRIKDIE
ncbi:acetyltransferase [Thalassotalea sp. 1_MG-2023]|uniref:acetyltransferase n=1 Tax=Thalassotalea sp. 1_MG-2023 TaxID=3062680 RepID=UPI0026E47F24|nr:acetyltransferase [Thalassotalea sp. 1_MG-2023]MDO6425529.1 acetyltransferase [Thalassotalea sp. 1_MG-2023]